MRLALVALCSLVVLAALEAAFYGLRYLADRRALDLRRRLQAIGASGALDAKLLRRARMASSTALAAFLRPLPGTERLARLLEQSDSRMTVAQLLGLSALCAAGGEVAALLLLRGPLPLGAAPVVCAALPALGALAARERRSHKLSEQLPDALDMMARSLRAGHALPAAFQVVAGEMPAPISIEFARAFEEQKLGVTLERAVQGMSGRAPGNGDLKIFAVSTVVQKETGGNLAEILENIATTIRERYRFFGKLKALTAEGKASGIVLGALPIAVGVLLSALNPTYLARLFDNGRGQAILATAIASWIAGVLWIHRLTKMEI
jgi:tight adherence protein B